MKQQFRLRLLILVLVLLTPVAAQAQPDAVRHDALHAFTTRHGHAWHIRWNEQTGTPASVLGSKTRPYGGTPQQAARAFLLENRDLFRMQPQLADLSHVRTLDHRGISHVKFQQTYQGLPVEGAEYLVHLHPDGRVDMANGVYYPTLKAPTQPALSEAAARRIALDDMGTAPLLLDAPTGTLAILPLGPRFHLAWKLHLASEDPAGAWIYFVDARSGIVLQKQSNHREIATLPSGAALHLAHPSMPRSEAPAASVSGQGYVYSTHPGLNANTVSRSLPRLNGSGYLRGTYVTIDNLVSPEAYSASNQFFYAPSNIHFDEVNVYYHLDRFRTNYINSLGVPPLGQITARVHLRENNAGFNPPARLDFGDSIDLFGNPYACCENFAHEDKIIYHEYMHAVNYTISGISAGGTGETGAIDEGLSDYFPGSYTGRSKILDYAAPASQRDMTNPQIVNYAQYQAAAPVSRHDGAEFFSAILWDLRDDIGKPDADAMTYRALYRITSQPDFMDYREAMLADAFLFGDAEACGVSSAFANRGLGDELLVNITGPYSIGQGQSGTWTATTPCTTGTHSYQWRYRYNGTGAWSNIVSTTPTYSRTMSYSDFELKATITHNGITEEDTQYITRCTNCTSDDGPKRSTTVETDLPTTLVLEQNYPNPFNPETSISYGLPQGGDVDLVVYDVLGRAVATLIEGYQEAGYHTAHFQPGDLPSGLYLYRLTAGDVHMTRRMLLLK